MTTPEQRFADLDRRVFALYDEEQYRAALDLLAARDPDLAPWVAELAHVEACLHGLLDDPAAALRALQAASDAGGWWDPEILTEDEDLAGLQSLPEFQELVALSASRRTPDPRPALVQLPRNGLPGGVVVALHGAGQTATRAAADWAAVLELGYALVCVDSSQRMSSNYRTWPERDRAVEDIGRALAELPAELAGLPVIAAGFSAGGRAALDWALTAEPMAAAGVIVVAPALRELPGEARTTLQPAALLIGEDDDLLEVVDNAAGQLTAFGLQIERVPGTAHEFPQSFGEVLRKLLPSCG